MNIIGDYIKKYEIYAVMDKNIDRAFIEYLENTELNYCEIAEIINNIASNKIHIMRYMVAFSLFKKLYKQNFWDAKTSNYFYHYLKFHGWEYETDIVAYLLSEKKYDMIGKFCSEHTFATFRDSFFMDDMIWQGVDYSKLEGINYSKLDSIDLSPRKIDTVEAQLKKILTIFGGLFLIVGLLCMIYRAFVKRCRF